MKKFVSSRTLIIDVDSENRSEKKAFTFKKKLKKVVILAWRQVLTSSSMELEGLSNYMEFDSLPKRCPKQIMGHYQFAT